MKNKSVRTLTRIAMMAALLAVCAWITVPSVIPFTLQTFGVFLTLKLLRGRAGSAAILLYVLLGAAGLPVFSSFGAGVGVLLGPTGGYILGFILSGLVFWLAEPVMRRPRDENLVLIAGLLLCYGFGTAWFTISGGSWGTPGALKRALTLCVLPYIIPDAVKLLLAHLVAGRLKKLEAFK